MDVSKIIFDKKKYHFLFPVTLDMTEQWEEPPYHLLETAVRSYQEDHPEWRFKSCSLHTNRLKAVWNAYKLNPRIPVVQVAIAEAYPDLPGFQATIDTKSNDRVLISLPEDLSLLRSWQPAWLESFVNQKLASSNYEARINSAQLRILYARALYGGETIENAAVGFNRRANPLKSGKAYQILASPNRLEVEVVIGDVLALEKAEMRARLQTEINDSLWSLAKAEQKSPYYRNLSKAVMKGLDDALEQPFILGLDLPFSLPGGFFLREEREAPFLGDFRTAAVSTQLQQKKARLLPDEISRGEQDMRLGLLIRRGVLAGSDKVAPAAEMSYVPPQSLVTAPNEVVRGFLKFAAHARIAYPNSHRELQGLTFTIPGAEAERYAAQVRDFWKSFIADFMATQSTEHPMILLCHHFPISLPKTQMKPRGLLAKVGAQDNATWLPMIVREMIALPHVLGDPQSIASYMAPEVSPAAVKKALEGLMKSGLVEFDSLSRRYVQKSRNLVTGDDKLIDKIRRFHEEISELAETMIADRYAGTESTAFAISIAASRFDEARQRIRTWVHELLERSDKEIDADQVFQISVQMFHGFRKPDEAAPAKAV